MKNALLWLANRLLLPILVTVLGGVWLHSSVNDTIRHNIEAVNSNINSLKSNIESNNTNIENRIEKRIENLSNRNANTNVLGTANFIKMQNIRKDPPETKVLLKRIGEGQAQFDALKCDSDGKTHAIQRERLDKWREDTLNDMRKISAIAAEMFLKYTPSSAISMPNTGCHSDIIDMSYEINMYITNLRTILFALAVE